MTKRPLQSNANLVQKEERCWTWNQRFMTGHSLGITFCHCFCFVLFCFYFFLRSKVSDANIANFWEFRKTSNNQCEINRHDALWIRKAMNFSKVRNVITCYRNTCYLEHLCWQQDMTFFSGVRHSTYIQTFINVDCISGNISLKTTFFRYLT